MKVSIKEDSPFLLRPKDAIRCTVLFNDQVLRTCWEADEERGLVDVLAASTPKGLGHLERTFTTYQGHVKLLWDGEPPTYLPKNN